MGFDDSCNTGLVLGLGLSPTPNNYNNAIKRSSGYKLEPSLTLSLSGDPSLTGADKLCRQTSSHSGVSSFSSGRVVKRERDGGEESPEEEETTERVISDYHEDEEGVSARKKLRLTKEQSALLEESFKHHSTLNPKQKQVLARQLNLRPRQVEVWFQNRRARTKLKQTEVDCEFLKKCCETLTDENMRLQKEIQELKTLKLTHQPLYMHMPASTLTMCPSCERIDGGGGNGGGGAGGGGSMTTAVVGDRREFAQFGQGPTTLTTIWQSEVSLSRISHHHSFGQVCPCALKKESNERVTLVRIHCVRYKFRSVGTVKREKIY